MWPSTNTMQSADPRGSCLRLRFNCHDLFPSPPHRQRYTRIEIQNQKHYDTKTWFPSIHPAHVSLISFTGRSCINWIERCFTNSMNRWRIQSASWTSKVRLGSSAFSWVNIWYAVDRPSRKLSDEGLLNRFLLNWTRKSKYVVWIQEGNFSVIRTL